MKGGKKGTVSAHKCESKAAMLYQLHLASEPKKWTIKKKIPKTTKVWFVKKAVLKLRMEEGIILFLEKAVSRSITWASSVIQIWTSGKMAPKSRAKVIVETKQF